MSSPTERFSTRVENYIKYRPGYPPELIDLLAAECGLGPATVVADLGSGPGQLARLFLEHGCAVYGVEPNREMREAGERILAGYPRFTSVAGRAEATGLPAASVDLISAGQAAHWFERQAARAEFARILRPGGWLALVWNERQFEGTPFQIAYEALLRTFGTDYAQVHHQHGASEVEEFFGPQGARQFLFANRQRLDFQGLCGRLLSASYIPEPGHPNYEPMIAELRRIFDGHQQDGAVTFDLDTRVYLGRL